MAKTAVSLFSNEAEASTIVGRLEDAGISHDKICTFAEGGSNRFWGGASDFGDEASGSTADRVSSYLMRNGVPADDAQTYAEGVRRGHALVAVRCDDDEADRVIDILDGDDALDIDEQQSSWRSAGWTGDGAGAAGAIGAAGSTTTGMTTGLMGAGSTGGTSGSTGMGSSTAGMTTDLTGDTDAGRSTDMTETTETTGRTGVGMTGSTGMTDATAATGSTDMDRTRDMERTTDMDRTTGDEVIPVAEEELHVSKREANRGRVRIHSHVVERPVEEQVSLREEHVHVERRPVEGGSREGTLSGDPFQERTIEVEERGEEAVVSKEARVKEELVVRKDVEERTETISDTVRSTEVEVEDETGNRISGTGTNDRK